MMGKHSKTETSGLHEGTGQQRIQAERLRQIIDENWTIEHDDRLWIGALAKAGTCYATNRLNPRSYSPSDWPFESKWWKPTSDRIRNLEKAGALIQAEIDKLERNRDYIAKQIDETLLELGAEEAFGEQIG